MTSTQAGDAPGSRGTAAASDISFPGWEAFVPRLVHPAKVALVEILLWIGEPLSAPQLGKVTRGAGKGFNEVNIRYHVKELVKVGVLEAVPGFRDPAGGPTEKYFFFAGEWCRRQEVDPDVHP
jgi:hypothetical protein